MSSPHSQRLRGSLGDSWGEAEYESDGSASVHSASDIESDVGSESDFGDNEEQEDMATPLPNRLTRTSSRTPQDTPVKTPTNRAVPRNIQSSKSSPRSQPRSYQSTPGSQSMEPSFIMPNMYQSSTNNNGSPLRKPKPNSKSQTSTTMRVPRDSGPAGTQRAAPSPRFAKQRQSSKQSSQPDSEPDAIKVQGPAYYINLILDYVFWPLVRYILSTLGITAEYLKPFIGMALALGVLSFAIMAASGYLTMTLDTARQSLCMFPGSSYVLSYCDYPAYSSEEVPYPDFEGVFSVQNTFQDILDASRDSQRLPAEMKKSEGMIRDVRSLVKHSNLPSRSELDVEFTYFVETAGEAVRALTKYNGKIHHTMDRLVSTSSWTQQTMHSISEKDASYGLVPRFVNALNPLSVFAAPAPKLEQQIYDHFLLHVGTVETDLQGLIGESETLLALLQNLENRLDHIADIANRDGSIVTKDRDELLSLLWSKLGGNASKRKGFEKSLALLSNILKYHREAAHHVGATLVRLHEIEAELENLRETVAAPAVLGWRDGMGLNFHLSNIDAGVERLKKVRGEAMTLEREQFRKGLGDEGLRELPGSVGQIPTVYAGRP
jgi:hypothetical protein